jgi:two-component system, LytTR family, sensor kinase
MLKALYNRYPFFSNMMAVLTLLIITRTLDSFAWVPPSPNKTKIILLNYLFEFIALIPIIFILIFSYRWTVKRKLTFLLYFLIVAFALLMPSLVLALSSWLAIIFGHKVQPITFNLIEKYTPGVSLVIFFLSAAYYLTYLVLKTARQRETAHKAESLAKDVQLKMLRYQINPHFLFNVLNSIYTLIDENTEKAKKLVIDMSEYYRYTLSKQQQTVTIEREIESILKYLEIQKTRFEEEFQYQISVDEAAKQIMIPTFLIHLLVENSVKYGTKTEKQKLIINLSVRVSANTLIIRVSNTGKLLNATPNGEKNIDGTGNGIENLKYRLSLYYNDNYSFSLKEENGFVTAAIEIPNINTR